MQFPSEIRSHRLVLRRPVQADAPAIFDGYARDPEVLRHLSWRPHRSLAETQGHLDYFTAQWATGERGAYVIDTAERTGVGGLDLRLGDEGRTVAVGYVLRRDHWGRGLMTEALGACIGVVMADPGVWRVWGHCDVENLASARVMEKAGMAFEGVLRRWALHPNRDPVRPRDCRAYALVREPAGRD